MLYGDPQHGAVYLPRYEFQPLYTTDATLEPPPWSIPDLPDVQPPTSSQRESCLTLTQGLVEWIRSYEANVADALGVEYRRSTLVTWDNGTRLFVPADNVVTAWQNLLHQVTNNFDVFLKNQP